MKVRLRYYYLTITLPNKRFHIDAWGDNTQYTILHDGENGKLISTLKGHCQFSALKKGRSKNLWFYEEMTNTYHTVLLENKYSIKEVTAGLART